MKWWWSLQAPQMMRMNIETWGHQLRKPKVFEGTKSELSKLEQHSWKPELGLNVFLIQSMTSNKAQVHQTCHIMSMRLGC